MTLAACSLRRRCWSWASAMACSSWTLGSAFSSNEELSLAVMYFHQRFIDLNMSGSLRQRVSRRSAAGAPGQAVDVLRAQQHEGAEVDDRAHHDRHAAAEDGAGAVGRQDGERH